MSDQPTALAQQLAQVQALAPQSPVPAQVMQQVLPDASNPQMPETATLPGMEQALPQTQQPSEYNQLAPAQAPQAPQPMQQQQQGIAQQPPQQMPQQDPQQLNMMHGRLRAANDEIRMLKQQAAMSAAQPATANQPQPAPPVQITAADVTDADCIQHYGQAYFDEWGVDAVKQQLVATKNMIEASTQPAAPVQNMDQVQKLSSQFFHGELSRMVPNYQTVEGNPQFETWLTGSVDPMSGMSYSDWLNDAYSEGDASRAAHIFQMFLGQGAGVPVYQQQPTQQPILQAQQPAYQQPVQPYMPVNQPMQQAVMPNTTGAPVQQMNAAPVMSKAQILQALVALPTQGLQPLELSTETAKLTALLKTAQAVPQQPQQHAGNVW